MEQKIKELQDKIGYTFQDSELLLSALMHSSYTNEKHLPKYQCNERLEFLGDAVLQIVISDYLFAHFKASPEGDLTKIRADLVCTRSLAGFARSIRLGDYLLLGHGQELVGGRDQNKILEDAFEALLGAL